LGKPLAERKTSEDTLLVQLWKGRDGAWGFSDSLGERLASKRGENLRKEGMMPLGTNHSGDDRSGEKSKKTTDQKGRKEAGGRTSRGTALTNGIK